ncbi:MAG: hypothetical protein KF767_08875 [Bdellovibrionaceae bacterium]|nr:hypothetical protein [Pseudobdellovibrionaceae bacterium]
MKLKTNEELNKLFQDAKTCDEELFAEQKSNLLLVSGDHYKRIEKNLREQLRGSSLTSQQKVKITKNHTQKICNREVNGIAALAPDVKCTPANRDELQDKKAAQLYQAVKLFGDKRYKLAERREKWIQDFVEIGEVATLVIWNPNKGDLINYHQKVDEEGQALFTAPDGSEVRQTGNPELDQMLKPAPDKTRPVFSGDFVFENIYGFNLHRAPDADDMDDSPYVIVDKMSMPEDVKAMIAEDDPEREEKLEFVKKSSETTYRIFDTNKLSFGDDKGKVHLRYHYYRPCMEYPQGYYYIQTEFGIITSGELPFGVWPIAYTGHTRLPTSPRHRSRIRVIRPYQVEINRASSQRIQHQLTHGDDKMITRPGAKASQEGTLPGIRTYKAFGDVQIIPGRVGDQFAGYVVEQIAEMYQVADEEAVEDSGMATEPLAILYSSVKRSKKHGKQAKAIVAFLQDVYGIYFELAKHYFDEHHFIKAVGRSEMINIAEFRTADKASVSITVEAANSDATDMLGRFMFTQNALQYVGKNLPPEAVGQILSNMPFANSEQILKPIMQNYRNVENDILALDRGEKRPAEPDDTHDLYVTELTSRIKSPDFKALDPQIQQAYFEKREQHRAFKAEELRQLAMAKQGFVPMGGSLVKCDVYVTINGKQQRMVLPYETLQWAHDIVNKQGMAQDSLQKFAPADQVAIAGQATEGLMQQQNQTQGGVNVGNGTVEPVI